LEPEENQDVVEEVLSESADWRQISIAEQISELEAAGRLAPHAAATLQSCITKKGSLLLLPGGLGADIQTDGFFAAMLERKP
jgi:16S rRNA C967 or C1407 C5-methylase (RsmB/RsmF family)